MWSTNSDRQCCPKLHIVISYLPEMTTVFFNCNFFFVVSFYFLLNGKMQVDNVS